MTDVRSRLTDALADRYDIEREVGAGGMATVYLAEDLKHRRKVAIKVLRPDLAALVGAERFLKEIDVTANLQHPHILPLHDSGETGDCLYYVMPFVDGASLRGVMNGQRHLDLSYVLQIATEVAGALDYAHRQGVLHRDIKPENILLSEGHAVVADFGIAKAISTAGGDNLTRTGVAIGTPGYMSPEQASGSSKVDARNDVFSLACVIYEMLTGVTPEMWPTDEEVRVGRFLDAPSSDRQTLDRLPVNIEQALTKAMAMRPAHRFPTPGDLVKALHEQPGKGRGYDTQQVKDIVRRAANDEVHHPTEDDSLTIGAVQRIGAEVGIRPARIKDAAVALDQPIYEEGRGRGLLGVPSKIYLERVIDREVSERQYESLLVEVRAAMGEVGTLNPTLGKSLSWSGSDHMDGAVQGLQVMVNPSGGKTRIRLTEGGGRPIAAAALVAGAGAGAFLGGALATVEGLPHLLEPFLAMGLVGGAVVARILIGRVMTSRYRKLRGLLRRMAGLVEEGEQGDDE